MEDADLLSVDCLLTYKLVRLQRMIDKYQTKNADRYGLTLPEIRLLFLIRRFKGKTLTESIRGTVADSGNSSRVANKLTALGYLRKEQDEDDARKSRLYLTHEGEVLATAALNSWRHFNQQLLEKFPPQDQKGLHSTLDDLTEKLAELTNFDIASTATNPD